MEMLTERQTDQKWTNEERNLHQFQKQLSYDGGSMSLSSLNSVRQSVFELESRNGMLMDRQMDKK